MKITPRFLFCLFVLFVATIYTKTLHAQIITTIAGNGTGTWAGDGLAATNASLKNPTTIALDAAGNLYIADWGNHRVRKVDPTGIISTIAGTGVPGSTGDGFPAVAAKLNHPNGVAVDGAGNVYIAEQSGHRIRKIDGSGIITTFAGTGTGGFSGDGGLAVAAKINSPTNVCLDAAGNVYIADWASNRIRKVDASGMISTIAGGGVTLGDGGPATAALLSNPYSVSFDIFGNLYLSDEHNYRLRKIDLSGIITTIAGTGVAGSTGDGGQATAALFDQPDGIVADAGNLYIADFSNNRIRKVVLSTGIVTNAAGTGVPGWFGDNGPATDAKINGPSGVVLDAKGNIYVADFANNIIRKIVNGNRLPSFVGGPLQSMTICENAVAVPVNPLLAVMDSDLAQKETWVLFSGPLHGTASVSYTATSTGDTITPAGLTYTPTSSYFGNDTFRVKVDDGVSIDTTTIIVTINPRPRPAVITGPSSVCIGLSVALADDTTGGIWSSSNTLIATVGSSSGIVTSVATGGVLINYTVTNPCGTTTVSKGITVNPLPGPPGGNLIVCVASSSTLTEPVSGTWISNDPSVATIGLGTGILTGVATGTTTITFTQSTGCVTTTTATVILAPDPIVGVNVICQGTSTLFTDLTPGGVWSTAFSYASIGPLTGVASATGAGVETISYSLGVGCTATQSLTINPAPTPISGSRVVCIGSSINLSDGLSGGSWTSSNAAATIDPSGVVTGWSVDTTTIAYSALGCSATTTVSVISTPSPITPPGIIGVCTGSTVTLADATPTGVWSSSNTSVATVGSGTGIVTGVSASNATITYKVGLSCIATAIVNVSPLPGAISGAANVCIGATSAYTDVVTGGTWASSNTSIATIVSGTGLLSAIAAGPITITYTSTAGCIATKAVSVNLFPNAGVITGPASVCIGSVITLTDAALGGTWSTSNTSAAVFIGYITGIAAGVDTVSYQVSNFCGIAIAKKVVTVDPIVTPAVSISVSPGDTICKGTLVTFVATPVNGGLTPVINWTKNGVSAYTGSAYSYFVASGDIVNCAMTTSAACVTATTASSNTITLHISPPVKNKVDIFLANPNVIRGRKDTFLAVTPFVATYQWYVDKKPVPGATDAMYVTDSLKTGQMVQCSVTSTDVCVAPSVLFSGIIKVVVSSGIENVLNVAGFELVPNPNKGVFTMNLVTPVTQSAQVIVTNIMGQKVKEFTATTNNIVDVKLDQPPGIYIFTAMTAEQRFVGKVVIE